MARNPKEKQRMAGESGAAEAFRDKGGKENAAFKGKVDKETPGASAFEKQKTARETVQNTKDVSRTNTVSEEQRKRYVDHFRKVAQKGFQGREAADADKLIADYEQKTKGLDADVAFKALEGGRNFGKESDLVRYNELMKKRGNATTSTSTSTTNTTTNSTAQQPGGTNSVNTSSQATNQTVDQSRSLGSSFTGNVTGNNNTIDLSNTDNSFNITEGNKIFNYQGGSGNSSYNDTPMSAMTLGQVALGGDGSNPTGAAKFLANFVGMNNTIQSQLKSNRQNHGAAAIKANEANRADPDPNNMINSMPQYMKDLSTTSMANTFGDPERWKMPKAPTFNTSTIQQDSLEALSKKSKKDKDDD